MKKYFFLALLLLLTPLAVAQQDTYQLKLLAVQEDPMHIVGSDADLFLELKDGSGRVFLDTFPVTRMDTQISTRFAKEIACKHFNLNCNNNDFIYTIKAKSNIIGGPSAGAAIAALTTIATLDLEYNDKVAVTGTINSGGIIGAVGGIKEKIEAAAGAGITKVLIPQGTATQPAIDNQTEPLNLIEYAKENFNLVVIEVSTINEVVFHFTGLDLNHKEFSIVENERYIDIMTGLQEVLCERTEKIEQEAQQNNVIITGEILTTVTQKKEDAINATNSNDFYSAASFCFGTNIDLKTYYYQQRQPSAAKVTELLKQVEQKTNILEKKLEQQTIDTIGDLQTLMIVKERISDVRDQITKFEERNPTEPIQNFYSLLAYTEERYFSALSWMQFFSLDGKKFNLDKEILENTCIQKISESEQRKQYAELYLSPLHLLSIQEKIDTARTALQQQEFALCLITASQAKADANAVLSTLGLENDTIDGFFQSKLQAAERVIAENSAEDTFPILGYSYYQYAQSLQETEKITALVYMEYALEMSELGIYFPSENEPNYITQTPPQVTSEMIAAFEGFVAGVILVFLILWMKPLLLQKKKRRKRKTTKRRKK